MAGLRPFIYTNDIWMQVSYKVGLCGLSEHLPSDSWVETLQVTADTKRTHSSVWFTPLAGPRGAASEDTRVEPCASCVSLIPGRLAPQGD